MASRGAPPSRRLGVLHRALKRKKHVIGPAVVAGKSAAKAVEASTETTEAKGTQSAFSDTALRNIALEAVKIGDYYSEDQAEVLAYIAEQYADLLKDQKYLKKYARKIQEENAFTQKYTVEQILAKKHAEDGYDIFVQPHEAVAAKEGADADAAGASQSGPLEVDPGVLGELQEGIEEAAAAAAGEADPVGDEELAELLEGCARACELPAAVYCAQRLEAAHAEGLPEPFLERAFQALKPLMRPRAARDPARLTGPWSLPSVSAARKVFGKLMDRLAKQRKEAQLASGGEAAEKADRAQKGEALLRELCDAFMPRLLADAEVRACSRKGNLVEEIARVARAAKLNASNAVVWDVVRVLEETGRLAVSGRDARLQAGDEGPDDSRRCLESFEGDLGLLDLMARERLDKRRKRQKSRDAAKAAKRRRTQ